MTATTPDYRAVDSASAAIVPGVGVTMFISDCPDPVFGVILNVYDDAIGNEVADVQLPGRRVAVQCTRFLKVVRPAVTS